eukprot:7023044-Pyramimonas_sp.AAC.2
MDMDYIMEYVEQVMHKSRYMTPGAAWDPMSVEALPVELFLKVERARTDCADLQHIFNKLLFDAIGEALAK